MPAYLKASIKRSFAEGFLNELESNQNQYFLFFGKTSQWQNENSPDAFTDTVAEEYKVSRNIVGYKKINPSNILFALPRYVWTHNTVYDVYDDTVNLFDSSSPKQFYVVTDENHIYKCLGRPAGAKSTVKPTYVLAEPFTSSDGYTWKYLATVKESNLPYELTDYLPIEYAVDSSDTETTNQFSSQIQAADGRITRLDFVTNGGASAAGYSYAEGYATPSQYINVGDYKIIGGKKYVYVPTSDNGKLSQYNTPSNYVGYCLRVVDTSINTQEINNYGIIVSAGSTGSGSAIRYFEIADDAIDFSVTPTSGVGYTRFSIVPHIRIYGDGNGAFAFPVLNSTKNITGVLLANGGANYTQALAKVVSPKDSATKVHPTIRAVIPPKGGHGSNILKELNVQDIIIIVEITEDDAENLIFGGQYRQFGIIKNPVINNGMMSIAGKEDPYYRDITLGYSGSVLLDKTLYSGLFNGQNENFLLGAESAVGSSIVGVKSLSSLGADTRFTLQVKNLGGKYITYDDRKTDFYLRFGTASDAQKFEVGEKVTQNINAGTSQARFVVRAEGVVLEKINNILKIRVTRNSFIANSAITGVKTKSTATPSLVYPVYGETALVYDTRQNTFYTEDGNKNIFTIISVGSPYFQLNETPAYSGLTVLDISTSATTSVGGIDTTSLPLSPTSFSVGDYVEQGLSTDNLSNYANGIVYHWEFVNNSFGRLYMSDVFGNFKNVKVDGITGSTLGSYIVNSVQEPQINSGSGEIIYINNVRPITRTQGQEEEFRMRLGF